MLPWFKSRNVNEKQFLNELKSIINSFFQINISDLRNKLSLAKENFNAEVRWLYDTYVDPPEDGDDDMGIYDQCDDSDGQSEEEDDGSKCTGNQRMVHAISGCYDPGGGGTDGSHSRDHPRAGR